MANPAITAFGSAFHNQYNRLPVWTPGADMAIGDVGVLLGGEFTKMTTLQDLGIRIDTDPGDSYTDYGFSSGHGVEAKTGISGQTSIPLGGVPPGNFGVAFKYQGLGSFSLTAPQCRVDRINDLISVQDSVLNLVDRDAGWELSWIYITTLVVASRYAIVISGASQASASLDLGITTPPVSFANASFNTSFTEIENVAWSGLSMEGGPLMFEGWQVHRRFLGSPKSKIRRLRPPLGRPMALPVTIREAFQFES